MPTWIIEPRDPLIFRDGRPFGPNPGARARSLPFPFPSTTTGGVRTRAGLNNEGVFDTARISEVKDISVKGPLLVELQESGQISWLLPAPADALLLPDGGKSDSPSAIRRHLVPLEIPVGAVTNLPANLTLVGLTTTEAQIKPHAKPPRFWYWKNYLPWLEDPQDKKAITIADLGHNGPTTEYRMHVSIDPATLTGVEGMLFQTSGLEFAKSQGKEPCIPATRLGLAVQSDAPFREGLAPLGGERRLMQWRQVQTENEAANWPEMPPELASKIAQQKKQACRLILATPAYFYEGYLPQWLFDAENNEINKRNRVTPTPQAIALPRPQVVSGWDFEIDKPKYTRRLVPAGTVFFLSLQGEAADIEKWVSEMWMTCISDDEQIRKDGFGLAVLGSWSGNLEKMEVKS